MNVARILMVRELVSSASTWPTSPPKNYFLKLPKILKYVMPKNLKETTIAPGQLRQKSYYFHFC
jgi:hypothetical protein